MERMVSLYSVRAEGEPPDPEEIVKFGLFGKPETYG